MWCGVSVCGGDMEPVASEASHLFRSSALAFPSSSESVPWEMVLTEIEEFNTSLAFFLSSEALSRSSRSCRWQPRPPPCPRCLGERGGVAWSLSQFGKHCDPSTFCSSSVKFCCSGLPLVCALPHRNQRQKAQPSPPSWCLETNGSNEK